MQVGAADAAPGGLDFDLALAARWDGDLLEAEVAFAVEAEGLHYGHVDGG